MAPLHEPLQKLQVEGYYAVCRALHASVMDWVSSPVLSTTPHWLRHAANNTNYARFRAVAGQKGIRSIWADPTASPPAG